jgi:hypothetical protein
MNSPASAIMLCTAVAAIAIGAAYNRDHVFTQRWWIAFGAGVVLYLLFWIDSGVGLVFGWFGMALLVAGILGFAQDLVPANRALFAAVASGMLTLLACRAALTFVARCFGGGDSARSDVSDDDQR